MAAFERVDDARASHLVRVRARVRVRVRVGVWARIRVRVSIPPHSAAARSWRRRGIRTR